jgi:hypothetical protein
MDFDQDPREVPGRDRPTESRLPHDHQSLFSARLVVGIVIVCIGLILLADNLATYCVACGRSRWCASAWRWCAVRITGAAAHGAGC